MFEHGEEHYVIKKRSYYFEETDNATPEKSYWVVQGDTIPVPPPPPPPDNHDLWVASLHFVVHKDFYVVYTNINDFAIDSVASKGTIEIFNVDRDSLYFTSFIPNAYKAGMEGKVDFRKSEDFKLEKINRSDRKTIAGHDCFYVRYTSTSTFFPSRYYEMYVTEDLKYNYHPIGIIRSRDLLFKFFPLYIKTGTKQGNTESFEEYIFFKRR